jgi:hypothetical protein
MSIVGVGIGGGAAGVNGTTGWSNLTTFSSVDTGDNVWTTPSVAENQDDVVSSVSFHAGAFTSDSLRAVGLVESVPGGATIRAITARVDRYAGDAVNAVDNTVQLVADGSAVGNNKASATAWPDSDTDTYVEYSWDLLEIMALGITAADVNGATFGWQLSVDGVLASFPESVDHMQIKIDYQE